MNRIILIGNGFDLAHGLKTSYKDFIDDFWEKVKINVSQSTTSKLYYDSNLLPINEHKYDDQNIKIQSTFPISFPSNEIKGYAWFKSLKESRNKIEFQYKNSFLKYISEKQLQNWVDIEYEYYRALNECLENNWEGGIEQLNKDFSTTQEALREYLKTQVVSDEKYSDFIAEKIFYPLLRNGKFDETKERWQKLLILDFNYTNTTSFYRQQYMPQKIIHIHGELDNPENPIIFGYGDEMDKKSWLIEDKNEKAYLINNKSIQYLQIQNYQEMLAFIEADDYEIFVMGHSCGISDRTLLNTLFEHEYCKKIKPFYYEKDGKNNYEDIVINIYRNFKDKKLCRARVEPKSNCEPLPQLQKS